MPVNTAVRAVVRSTGQAALLGVLRLRVGAFTFVLSIQQRGCGKSIVPAEGFRWPFYRIHNRRRLVVNHLVGRVNRL